jgi:hypothetical protein
MIIYAFFISISAELLSNIADFPYLLLYHAYMMHALIFGHRTQGGEKQQ